MSAAGGGWVVRFGPRPRAALRLFCFPHAGAGAGFYRPWAAALPPWVEPVGVQPPGREGRSPEPPFTNFQPLLGSLVAALRSHLVPPFAFFGHSMGALLAFEVARELQRLGGPLPERLIVSGRRAPTRPYPEAGLHLLPDAELLRWLRGHGGTPEEVLRHGEFVRFLLPTLRADLSVCAGYRHEPGPPLACPLVALGGTRDPEVGADDLAAWADQAGAGFAARLFPGGHFYLKECPDFLPALAEYLAGRVAPVTASCQPPADPRPGPGEVHVWRGRTDLPAAEVARLAAVCSDDERAKAGRFHRPEHRDRSIVCRGTLRELLARYAAVPAGELVFATGPRGKPSLVRPPGAPDLRFNLSHSGSVLLVAVTLGAEVGVDVEEVRPMPDALAIAGRYFARSERAAIEAAGDAARPAAFFRLWARKEAYLKGRGDGIAFGLDRFRVWAGPGPPLLLWVDGEPDSPAQWRLADLDAGAGRAAACAVQSPGAAFRLFEVPGAAGTGGSL